MTLDLMRLERLPGADDGNFEELTRAIVSRRYGALGTLRERRNQPGVEFYLRVEHAGELGEPGRVWGWSCKWFILGRDNELTSGQRDQITDSVDKAIKYIDGLTDYVLCLPQRPAKKDEEWIDGLGPARGISTKLWAANNFDAQLAGFDELRSTFFGELVLIPDVLAAAHECSVAPVKARWLRPLHTSNHVERQLERALLRPAAFDAADEHIDAIAARAGALRDALTDIDDDATRASAKDIADDLDLFVAGLRAIVAAGRNRRPMEVRDRVADQQPPATSPRKLRALVFALRKRRLPVALDVSGLGAEIRDVVGWLEEVRADLLAPLIAIVGAAGMGKTYLAAQLTAPTGRPTAGVFIQGNHLRFGRSLDDLARRIPRLKVERFEDLLEALNSAGARAGSRIPLVIDGLNEAERPLEWRPLLDELMPALGDFPNVLMIVTLREPLAARVVPDTAAAMDLEWREPEVIDIVNTYFDHYLITPGGAWLPSEMFGNPLFVRMYCEAANPGRENPVGVEALPTSLVGVFERYRDVVVDRLAEDPARVQVPADQIKRRLGAFALEIWTRGVRRLPSDDARAILDAGPTSWDESLFRRLVEEGVLLREEVDGSDDTEAGILFDRFGGYLIADAVLVRMTHTEVKERLAEASLWNTLLGVDGHPLGEDIAVGLTGLVPRRFVRHHLWRFAPDEYRSWALAQELDAESEFLDDGTVDELATLIATGAWKAPGPSRHGRRHPFDRLWEVRSSPAHRLNAVFLDRVLRLLSLPERDRQWTEWVRHNASGLIVGNLKELIEYWTGDPNRVEIDDLDALAIAWLLTSTNAQVRDLATKALQRYGRPESNRLFDLATRMLDVDDPYVVERVISAAFGAAGAHQMPDPGGTFERALAGWLVELRDRFLEEGSTSTSHELLRDYLRATFEFAGTLHPGAVPDGVDPAALTFAVVPPAPVMADDDANAEECKISFGMDFENYVIGSAIEGRRNYDFTHAAFRRARGEVMARVWDLGWRAALLGEVDRGIADDAARRFGGDRAMVERYGKKYGWIAYYELIGRLVDTGQNRDRWVVGGGRNVSPDIDPSFPDEPPAAPVQLPEWAPASSTDDEVWLRNGGVSVPAEFWSPEEIYGVTGGWLLTEGFLRHRRDGRTVFGFFRTLLLEPADAAPALEMINGREYLGNQFFPDLPTVGGVFAGEVPWSPRFARRFDDDDDDPYSRPALRHYWNDEGIALGQVAVALSTGDGGSPTILEQSYDVPSFEFAARFNLRQLPGTLDLVSLDGVRASATFGTEEPWNGHLLFLRRDLVVKFAGDRQIVHVAWGEREVTVDWNSVPPWVDEARRAYEHVWRNVRVIGEQQDAIQGDA
ncbi:NACHT domain-containing NTPase [Parafrankia sp. BMG5.11]|uniref:NACHT domain-containing protein n=1 Tax=Parafrankia sp. BMG5.11 TaxID=222540 RepID=UPI00103DFB2F|nr:ATP-binding protein [Parafrankia sp. BMG5.11]TCJ32303.1 ATP-binding protein [Parafrankia sp. BMG5.11]